MKVTATSYDELRSYVQAFRKGSFQILFIVGAPGQSKSTIVKEVLGPKARLIKGGAISAFQLYMELWRHKDKTFILDDSEQIYRDQDLARLLKALCETEKVKQVSWLKAVFQLKEEGIANEFETKSRVVIITNEWASVSKHIESLEDRGLMVFFRPSVEEVMKVGKTFVKDKAVVKFVEQNRRYIENVSLRALKIAAEMKQAGLGWQEPLMESLGIKNLMLVKKLCDDRKFLRDEDRVQEFSRLTGREGSPGLSRTTFFTLKRKCEDLKLRDRRGVMA